MIKKSIIIISVHKGFVENQSSVLVLYFYFIIFYFIRHKGNIYQVKYWSRHKKSFTKDDDCWERDILLIKFQAVKHIQIRLWNIFKLGFLLLRLVPNYMDDKLHSTKFQLNCPLKARYLIVIFISFYLMLKTKLTL